MSSPKVSRRGRLVCAIFTNQPGSIEVAVHPADVARRGTQAIYLRAIRVGGLYGELHG